MQFEAQRKEERPIGCYWKRCGQGYTTDQMKNMQQFLKSDPDHILGIDRTFNLGAVYVANFVYKNIQVVNKETSDHLIFVGPMFLHWDGSFLSYHTFLSHIKARLSETIRHINIRIASDDESGLTKAIDNVFPNVQRLLCIKLIKDNISDHLKNKTGVTDKDRAEILSEMFGYNGLLNACDLSEFNLLSNELCTKYYNSRS